MTVKYPIDILNLFKFNTKSPFSPLKELILVGEGYLEFFDASILGNLFGLPFGLGLGLRPNVCNFLGRPIILVANLQNRDR